jgi:hypothetical protein
VSGSFQAINRQADFLIGAFFSQAGKVLVNSRTRDRRERQAY